MIERNREDAETDVPLARNPRQDEGRELHDVAVPGPFEVMVGEPDVVAELGQPHRLLYRHVDDAVIVRGLDVIRQVHVHGHRRKLH